jgi:hypothetical protein
MGLFFFYLLIGVAILALLWLAMRAYAQTEPRRIVGALKWLALAVGGGFAIWLLATGRLGQALFLTAALAPMFMRWKSILAQLGNLRGPSPGRQSEMETPYLRMRLDHDTGALDGLVLEGRFQGKRLAELTPDELLDLLRQLRIDDGEGAAVLEAYLDRVHADWRNLAGAAGGESASDPAPSSTAMSREEAYRILGLEPGADEKAIRDAHRRLMMRLHPDQGGSTYLAAKINQAKDLLLGDKA